MGLLQLAADGAAGVIQAVARRINPEPFVQVQQMLEAMDDYGREVIKAFAVDRMRLLPYDDGQEGETPAMVQAYPQMMKEAPVKSAIFQIILPVCFLNLEMEPASDNPVDKEAAEFIKDNVTRSKGGVSHMVEGTLLPACVSGYSLAEKIWRPSERGRWRGRTMLTGIKSRSIRHYDLEIDKFLNVTKVIGRLDQKPWPTSKFVIHRNMPMYEHPKGTSELKACYRPAWMLDTTWKLRMSGLQRYSMPFFKGTYPSNSTTIRNSLEKALKNVRGDGYALFPTGAMVEAIDIAGRSQSDFAAAVEHLRQEIFLAVNLAYMQSVQGSTPEGRGSAAISMGVTELRIWRLAEDLASIINDQIIPQLMAWNYPGRDYPVARFSGINDTDIMRELQIDKLMQDMGFPVSIQSLVARTKRQPALTPADTLRAPAIAQGAGGATGTGDPSVPDVLPNLTQEGFNDGSDANGTMTNVYQIIALQKAYTAGELERSAAIENACSIGKVPRDQAEKLFPQATPTQLLPEQVGAGTIPPVENDDVSTMTQKPKPTLMDDDQETEEAGGEEGEGK